MNDMEQDGAGDDRRFRMTFKSAAGQLQDDPRFLIINRGILVNMQHIRNMTNPSCYMDDGTSKDIVFKLAYDNRFDWSYWTRGYTRAAKDGTSVKASGKFTTPTPTE